MIKQGKGLNFELLTKYLYKVNKPCGQVVYQCAIKEFKLATTLPGITILQVCAFLLLSFAVYDLYRARCWNLLELLLNNSLFSLSKCYVMPLACMSPILYHVVTYNDVIFTILFVR